VSGSAVAFALPLSVGFFDDNKAGQRKLPVSCSRFFRFQCCRFWFGGKGWTDGRTDGRGRTYLEEVTRGSLVFYEKNLDMTARGASRGG